MPIPNDYKVQIPEKKEFELLPDDTYQVRVSGIELKQGQLVFQKPDEVEDRFEFEFTITETGPYKGRKLWQNTSTVMSAGSNGYSPSKLYKLFCAVNQITLSDNDAKTVTAHNINDMAEKELRLVVKQEPNRKGEVKNKIKDVLPLKFSAKVEASSSADDINVDNIPF